MQVKKQPQITPGAGTSVSKPMRTALPSLVRSVCLIRKVKEATTEQEVLV